MKRTLVMKRLALLSVFASLLVYADHASRQPFPGNARVKFWSVQREASLRGCAFASQMQQASILHLLVIYLYPSQQADLLGT